MRIYSAKISESPHDFILHCREVLSDKKPRVGSSAAKWKTEAWFPNYAQHRVLVASQGLVQHSSQKVNIASRLSG